MEDSLLLEVTGGPDGQWQACLPVQMPAGDSPVEQCGQSVPANSELHSVPRLPVPVANVCKAAGQHHAYVSRFLLLFMMLQLPGAGETPAYHYGTHYSSAMIVASYLVRMEPFTQIFLRLQVRLEFKFFPF